MLVLPSEWDAFIRAEGEAAYPNECCGALLGEVDGAGVKSVKRAVAIHNAREDGEQYHRFLITPDDLLRVEQTARASRLDVIGFYHSHPDHPAIPSGYDKDHALPFYSYVIVSVRKGAADELTSSELTADRTGFLPEDIAKED
ncbi:MAG: M67 family metallopeptidase [Zoogloeaceae bacterium]|jgi:proteasome lid subunit RPN8/RPN11|nr:M67 family metallopeptidase [Zoogloeaceae bacterium]